MATERGKRIFIEILALHQVARTLAVRLKSLAARYLSLWNALPPHRSLCLAQLSG